MSIHDWLSFMSVTQELGKKFTATILFVERSNFRLVLMDVGKLTIIF